MVSKEPNHHRKSANYKRKSTISVATIIAILKNPFYYGMMSVKGQLMPHIHGNIIDKELFDKVQEILKERCETRKGYFHPQKHPQVYCAFRGLIKCGKCGKTLSPDTKIKSNHKQYTYLRCYSKCGQPTINENVLFQQLEKEIFNPLYISPTQLIALRKAICKKFDDLLANTQKIRQQLTNQLNELILQEDKATDLFIQGKLQEDIYNRKLSAINQEKQALRVELDKHGDHEGNKIEVIFKIIEIAGNLTNLMKNENPKKQQALLNLIIKDCTLNNQELTYSIKPPFDQLLKYNNPKKWKDIIISDLSAFTDIEYYIRSLENKDY